MTFGSEIHVPLRMNCNNFGDSMTFNLAPSSGQSFNVSNTLRPNTCRTDDIPISFVLLCFRC